MDANKLKVLQEIGYTIKKSCGWCMFFTGQPIQPFGTCAVQGYEHLKHNASARDLSVYRYGTCNKFQANPAHQWQQGLFEQFVEKTNEPLDIER